MTLLSQKDRFLSNELFDCPVCGQPIVQIESQLKNHIGCLSGHYDRYDLIPKKIKSKSGFFIYLAKVGKHTMGVHHDQYLDQYLFRKELITSDGCFIRSVYCYNGIQEEPLVLFYAEIFDANFDLQIDSDKYVNIAFNNVSDWIANNKIMK